MPQPALANGFMLALETIRTHKLRAFLTVLGVIVGTGTIIGVGAILTGFDGAITAVLSSFGPNSIIVFKFPVGPREGRLTPEERSRKDLSYESCQRLRDDCLACAQVSPMLFPSGGPIVTKYKGNAVYQTDLFGVEEAYGEGGQVDINLGRFLTDEENRRRMAVAVIGADVEKALFAREDPI